MQSGGDDMGTAENRKTKTENSAPKPKALVLYGYGLNCDYETAYALERAGPKPSGSMSAISSAARPAS